VHIGMTQRDFEEENGHEHLEQIEGTLQLSDCR
jgi:hypothetical protein